MRSIFSLSLLFSLVFSWQPARSQQFIWAKQCAASNTTGDACDPVLEEGGNSYWGGNFLDSVSFDGIKLHTTNAYTSRQLFVTKLNSAGKVLWALSNTGTGYTELNGIRKDNMSHLYLYGAFEGKVNFGSHSITGDIGIFSYFVAKCDTAGNFLWAKSYNNSYSPSVYKIRLRSLTCDRLGGIYIHGNANGTYNANGISYSFTGQDQGAFIASLSPSTGNAVWTKLIVGDAYQWPSSIATDDSNNLVVSGGFGWVPNALAGKYIVFNGTDTLRTTANNNSLCTYLAKYNTNGVYQWATQIGAIGGNGVDKITCDSAGNTYMIHAMSDTVGGVYRPSQFASKMDLNGNLVWRVPMQQAMDADNIVANKGGLYIAGIAGDTMIYQGQQYVQKGKHNVILKVDPATAAPVWLAPAVSYSYPSGLAVCNTSLLLAGINNARSKFGANQLFNGDNRWYSFITLLNDTSIVSTGSSSIRGTIYNDVNNDCQNNTGDAGLKGFSVQALPGLYYAVADIAGNYELRVPPGSYNVQQITPLSHGMTDTQSCAPFSYTVTLPAANQVSSGNDFGNSYQDCQFLKVTTKRNGFLCKKTLARDFTIWNYGLDTARAVTLKVHYPGTVLSPVWSSIPWTSYNPLDSTLRFDLGDLGPDSSLIITVKDTAACISVPSLFSYPFKVTLTPINTCYPSDTSYNYANFSDGPYLPVGLPIVQQAERNIEVFPNPSTGIVNITGLEVGDLLQVFSAFGSRISEEKIGNSKSVIDLSQQPTGVYFISVRGEQITLVKKVMKL